MPHIFDGTADKSFHMIAIRSDGRRPSQQQMQQIDDVVADMHGFALRTGGGMESASNQYAIGYALPKGVTLNLNSMNIVETLENKCDYFSDKEPFVTLTPITLSEDELNSAEIIGTPPQEALAGLAEFRDDLDEYGTF